MSTILDRYRHHLTDKQIRVLELVNQGHRDRQIALALGITEATVRGHKDAAARRIIRAMENTHP